MDDTDSWHGASLEQLARDLASGRRTSLELVDSYLDRIARYDRGGPRLNAVLEVNPDVREEAGRLDRERRDKGPRGPLHGLPILVKDNIDTADRMHTSAGSLALKDWTPNDDAFVIKRLRAAGMVLLGKANMTEWANFMTRGMPNGYSSRGGQVLNPFGPGRLDVGGSSSGSAAAVAAGLAPAAIGTETSGSILNPASRNGVVGIKPTVGLVSRTGIIPIAHSQDTAGPIATCVADAARLLGAMAGPDPADPATGEICAVADYTRFLDADGLRGARIGVPGPGFVDQLDSGQRACLNRALDAMRMLGAVVIEEGIVLPSMREWNISTVLLHEFKHDLNAYLAKLPAGSPVRSLADLIAFNRAHPECLRYGQALLEESEATDGTLSDPEYLNARALDVAMAREEGIDRQLAAFRLDALVFVDNLGAAVAAKAGYPSITVPGGLTDEGRPVGITFTAGAFSEAVLIRLAYAFEQATRFRVVPPLDESPMRGA